MTALATTQHVRQSVRVSGLVQGVGFRPFVHHTATALGLAGRVGNDSTGVLIEVEGPAPSVASFIAALSEQAPPLARVDSVVAEPLPCSNTPGFEIVVSAAAGTASTYVAPDAAVCTHCLAELFDPSDHRYRYPFITCTNCGPRFTITVRLPYDRANTTMAGFALCDVCSAQYLDPADRRFHAQPLACAACGPRLWLEQSHDRGAVRVDGVDAAVAATQCLLLDGAIVAVKGLGGYHLACDARSASAVARLRERKRRADKPFAVMVSDLSAAASVVRFDEAEGELLESPARPIVLLPRLDRGPVVDGVAPGNPYLGVLLPYTPLHHLLFSAVPGRDAPVPDVLVMTSGNLTDEPICFVDDDARERLAGIADAFLVHDRPIHVPCDDSVVRVIGDRVVPIRRSRGYAPMPIALPVLSPPALAVGGELKNTFCVARGSDAWLGQHIGDMGTVETLDAFERCTQHLRTLYGIDPAVVAVDLHPGYHTTAWAERRGMEDVRTVQHHHAHLAALLAEHGEPIDTCVVGVVFDGTGYGCDATIWGGEILLGGYADVERVGHLRPIPLPGGDAAIRRPYRVALAHLWAAGIAWDPRLPAVAAAAGELDTIARQFERNVHCVPTTSAGRLFDAVAALAGVRQSVTYEAQAAMELEHLAGTAIEVVPYRIDVAGGVLEPAPMLRAIVSDVLAGRPPAEIAAAFHAGLADAVAIAVGAVGAERNVNTVGLTGGVFQNALLTDWVRDRLQAAGLRVLTHTLVPPNDGGLALGQVAVVATRAHAAADLQHEEV